MFHQKVQNLVLHFLIIAVALASPSIARSAEVLIKNITDVEGDRKNYLVGLGLVVGLNATGGETPLTRQTVTRFVEQLGVAASPVLRANLRNDTRQSTDNVSLVAVSAELSTADQVGTEIDVTVMALDDATSLQNGTLLPTPLYGADDYVYAIASGKVNTGGLATAGDAASVQKNHPTSGVTRALVEQQVFNPHHQQHFLRLLLRNPDYSTATRITDAINEQFPHAARTLGRGMVQVTVPSNYFGERFRFIAEIQQLRVVPDVAARVVINEQTGTVVIGQNVRISRALVTHANIAVIKGENPQVSQPQAFSEGQTTVVPRTEIDVVEESNPLTLLEETTTVSDLAQALNALGVTPQDLSSIFRSLHASGDLHAELIFK